MSKKRNRSTNRVIKSVKAAGTALAGFFARIGKAVVFDRIDGKQDAAAPVKRIRNATRLSVMLGILILLLIIAILLLRGCQGEVPPYGSVDIPGNVIDPPDEPIPVVPAADLEFKTNSDEENIPFNIQAMDGGDSESIYYRVSATYNSDFILKYDMTIRDGEEFRMLAEILKIKVELVSEDGAALLYDGLMEQMEPVQILLSARQTVTEEYLLRVTMYLDAPLDQQYYGKKLLADMSWWIEGQDHISVANHEFITVSPSIPPEPPVIVPDLVFAERNEGDNTPFDMKDIRNGDSASKYFAFEVTHGEDMTVMLGNTVVLDSILADVLMAKVELVGESGNTMLYEGLLKDISAQHTIPANDECKTKLYYKVTVTADGLTENYCETKLVCDLWWSLAGTTEQLKVPSNRFEAYEKPYIPPTPPTPPQPPVTATTIELTAKDGYDNLPFAVENMLPGDSVEQYYCVSVTSDEEQTVRFAVSLDAAQKLSAVLRVRVEQLVPDAQDIVLYDGLMKDCAAVDIQIPASGGNATPVYYRVTVYTNGAEVGNEYAGESLTADFSWELQ